MDNTTVQNSTPTWVQSLELYFSYRLRETDNLSFSEKAIYVSQPKKYIEVKEQFLPYLGIYKSFPTRINISWPLKLFDVLSCYFHLSIVLKLAFEDFSLDARIRDSLLTHAEGVEDKL